MALDPFCPEIGNDIQAVFYGKGVVDPLQVSLNVCFPNVLEHLFQDLLQRPVHGYVLPDKPSDGVTGDSCFLANGLFAFI